jgi:hypothetical protein
MDDPSPDTAPHVSAPSTAPRFAPGRTPAHRRRRQPYAAQHARDPDHDMLLGWLAGCAQPDALDVDGHLAPDLAFTQLLGRLAPSAHPLPPDAAKILGLPSHATVGDAATELLLAVTDPAGPRCRSYRSAVYYLQGDPGPLFTT